MESTTKQESKKSNGKSEGTTKIASSNEQVIKKLENTPFMMVGTDQGWRGVVGEWAVTGWYKDEKDLKKELLVITWNKLTRVIMILIERQAEVRELHNNAKKQQKND